MHHTVPAELLELHSRDRMLCLGLQVEGARVDVRVPLTDRTLRAIPHLQALAGHHHGCSATSDVGVGLLLRTVTALGAQTECLVLRTGSSPAFWLRVRGGSRSRLVDLDVLDALGLLVSGRVAVEVEQPDTDWDAALSRLLDD